jgi:intein-encoded DNA endonuclease-like protein
MVTTLQTLIEERLDTKIGKWLNARRAEGLTYREIADLLEEETGVSVSKSSIHGWLN